MSRCWKTFEIGQLVCSGFLYGGLWKGRRGRRLFGRLLFVHLPFTFTLTLTLTLTFTFTPTFTSTFTPTFSSTFTTSTSHQPRFPLYQSHLFATSRLWRMRRPITTGLGHRIAAAWPSSTSQSSYLSVAFETKLALSYSSNQQLAFTPSHLNSFSCLPTDVLACTRARAGQQAHENV